MKKEKGYVLALALLALAGLSGCAPQEGQIFWESAFQSESETVKVEPESAGLISAQTEGESEYLVVDVSGAVARPGVYELPEGARVRDAVELAGGLLAEADRSALNQAALLRDADKIQVYTLQETAKGLGMADSGAGTVAAKVDLNHADLAQLCTLSGIGEARARDIIAYREANGGFQTTEEIMQVSGIKEATFQKIKDQIEVR